MRAFIESVRIAVRQRNWHAALALALTLPDICADLEDPGTRGQSEARYVKWWKTYLSKNAGSLTTPGKSPTGSLSGKDCYALRCSFLHQGLSDIAHQRARDVVSRFLFVAPTGKVIAHFNKVNDALQLQVDIFCEDICKGVEEWVREKLSKDPEIQKRAEKMLTISSLPGFIRSRPS
jgi:hypothetical protein